MQIQPGRVEEFVIVLNGVLQKWYPLRALRHQERNYAATTGSLTVARRTTVHPAIAFPYLLGLFLLPILPASSHAQEPREVVPSLGPIRVSVDRVNFDVKVTGSHGKFIKGFRREDFRIFDDSVEQPVTGFLSIEEPVQVVLLSEGAPQHFF